VRGEHARRRHRLAGGLEGDPALLHQHADPLQAQEGRMPLVHVVDVRGDAQGFQGPHPADAEEDLLANPHFLVAAVELAGDLAVLGGVLRHVGVEQIQRHPPHPHAPDLRLDLPPGEVHADHHRRLVAEHLRHRQVVEIVPREQLQLPPVGVEALAEVALLVQQPDPRQRDAQLRGALEVVARQHAQPAGVDRQRLGQPELGAEVRDPGRLRRAVVLRPPRAARQVVLQLVVRAPELGEEPGVPAARVQPLLADLPEHVHGIVPGGLPELRIQSPEHVADLPAPRPAQVHRQIDQPREVLRQRRLDLKRSQWSHRLGQVLTHAAPKARSHPEPTSNTSVNSPGKITSIATQRVRSKEDFALPVGGDSPGPAAVTVL